MNKQTNKTDKISYKYYMLVTIDLVLMFCNHTATHAPSQWRHLNTKHKQTNENTIGS